MDQCPEIRTAAPEEFAAASAIIRAAYDEFRPVFTEAQWLVRIAAFSDVWKHPDDAELIAAFVEGTMAGVVLFYPDGSLSKQGEWPPGWAGMLRLAVHPGHRRSGIARALTDECLRRCRERRIATLGLHSANWMPTARAMYERMGFIRSPEFDFYPSANTTGMGYRFELDF